MKNIMLLFAFITFIIPHTVSAVVVRFDSYHTLESSQAAKTEVMVSEVTEEELQWKMREFKDFLFDEKSKDVLPSYIYASPEESFLKEKNWNPIISEEEILGSLEGMSFSRSTRVDIPAEWFDTSSGRTPQNESNPLAEEFDRYYFKKYKTRRITLIAARTIINGAVATTGFIAGGLPITQAMVVGPLTGMMSGSLQVYSKQVLEYLETNKYEIKIKKLLGMKTKEVTSSKFFSSQLKWFSMEFGFLAILDIARFAIGALPPTTLGNEGFSLALTSAKSLASQGLVDTSVAKELGPKIREAIALKDFEKAAKLRFRTELFGFSASMVWAGAAITDMMGMPIGNYLFIGMGTTGGVNHLRLIMKDKFDKIGSSLKKAIDCSWLFRKFRT